MRGSATRLVAVVQGVVMSVLMSVVVGAVMGAVMGVVMGVAPAPSAAAQGVNEGELPRHPIPYRLLAARPHRPHPARPQRPAPPAAPSGALGQPSPPPGGAQAAPGAPRGPASLTAPSAPTPGPIQVPTQGPIASAPGRAAGPASPPTPPQGSAPAPGAPPGGVEAPPQASGPAPSEGAVPPQAPGLKGPAPAPPRGGRGVTPSAPLPEADLAAFVGGEIAAARGRGRIAGAVVAIVQNGRVALLKGYGEAADGKIMDPSATRMRLGTASNLLTRLEALRQADLGRIGLDRPVNAFLPTDLQIPDEGFVAPVLVRHLLTDTAGFEDRALGRRYHLAASDLASLRDALARVRPRRVRPAGVGAVPSVYGAALLGEIEGLVAGKPFEDLADADLLKALGMSRTSFREPRPPMEGLPAPLNAPAAAALAVGRARSSAGLTDVPFAFGGSLAPALSATTTAQDMARLSLALLGGGADGATPSLGFRTADPLAPGLWRGAGGLPGASAAFAGLRLPGGRMGLGAFGSAPGFVSSLVLAPSLDLGVFVAATGDDPDLSETLAPTLVAQFFGGDPAAPGSPGPAAQATLLSAERAYHGLEAFVDGVRLRERLATTPDGALAEIRGEGRALDFKRSPDGRYRSPAGGLLYLPIQDGDAQGFVRDGGRGAGEPASPIRSLALLGGLAGAAALFSIANVFAALGRLRTEPRETPQQGLASGIALFASLAWLAAMTLAAIFLAGGLDEQRLLADWPSRSLISASWLAVLGAFLSALALVQLPRIFPEGRRVHGWGWMRKLGHVLTLSVFLALAVVLTAWGGLEPWSS